MAIPQKTRDEILVEAGHRCCRCLSDSPEVDLHHIQPQAEGGTDDADNLIVLCPTCHRLTHRYKFTKYQLLLYKEKAQELAYQVDWYGRRDVSNDDRGIVTLLTRLAEHAKGWYDEYVSVVIPITEPIGDDEQVSKCVLQYIWSRHHLPDVVAIQGVLSDLGGYTDLAADIEVFVRLLATADPLTGTYCCHVKPYWSQETCDLADRVYRESHHHIRFASPEGVALLKSIEGQLNVIVQEAYSHAAGTAKGRKTKTPNKPDARDGL